MAPARVVRSKCSHRLDGDGPVVTAGNRFLEQLVVRAFSPATVRAYAFDLANFDRFLVDSSLDRGYFTNAEEMVANIAQASREGNLATKLKTYTAPSVKHPGFCRGSG